MTKADVQNSLFQWAVNNSLQVGSIGQFVDLKTIQTA